MDSDQIALKWMFRMHEIAERWGASPSGQLQLIMEIAAAGHVLDFNLTPENVEGWIEGRLADYEERCRAANPDYKPPVRRKRKRPVA